jgi:Putative Flp pilus-assembly TadE/G-like
LNRSASSEGGQAALTMVLSLTMLFGAMGFSADLGYGYYRKQASRAAADAAALAAAEWAAANTPNCTSLSCTSGTACHSISSGNALYVGCQYATTNGFTDNQGGRTVTMSSGSGSSSSAPGTSSSYWVTANITETEHNLFLGFVGPASSTVAAQATAGLMASASASTPCIYVLSPTATNAFNIGNAANVTTTSCGVYVNSNANPGMLVTGGASVTSSTIDVVGTVAKNNGGTTSSTPVTGATAVADPFSSLPSPTPSGTCTSGNFTSWQATPYTPQPGTYCNGFNLSNGMGAVMASGVYIISGGTFNIQSGPLTCAAGGVTIYLTGTATVNIANGSSVTLNAQGTGSYEGILFYQDRTVSSPGSSTFAGGASMNLNGSLYLPHAAVTINNGTNTNTGALVVSTVNFQGGANFHSGTQAQTGLSSSNGYTPYLIQ